MSSLGRQGDVVRRDSLTGLRFVAALFVLVYHWWNTHPDMAGGRLASVGYTGVGLFFVLSGFVLGINYRSPQPRAFYRARVARIYPVYVLGLAVAIPLFASGAFDSPVVGGLVAVTTPVLLQAWFPHSVNWNTAGWSLSVEAFFYAMFPFLRIERRHWALIAAGWACAMAIAVVGTVWLRPTWETKGIVDLFKYLPPIHLFEFAMGIWLARMPKRAAVPWRSIAGCVSVALIGLLWLQPFPYLVFHSGVLAPLWGLLIFSLWEERTPLRHLSFLGRASYALYMLHLPLRVYAEKGPVELGFLPYLVLSIAASIAAYQWVEEPLRRRFRAKGPTETASQTSAIHLKEPI